MNHRTTLIEMTNQLIMALQPQRCFDTVAGMPPALLDFSGYSEASSFFGSLQSVSTTVLPSAGPFATAAAPETDIGGSNYVTIPPFSGSSLAEYFSDTAETDQISFSKDWLCGFQRYHKAVVKHLDEDPHEVLSRLTLQMSLKQASHTCERLKRAMRWRLERVRAKCKKRPKKRSRPERT